MSIIDSIIDDLLAEGQKIIGEREIEQERRADERKKFLAVLFKDARQAGIEAFGPLGRCLSVEPTVTPDNWNPEYDHKISFSVRPFGCVAISVTIEGSRPGDWNDKDRDWKWSLATGTRRSNEGKFSIGAHFRPDSELEEVYPDVWVDTASLAEAVAIAKANEAKREEAVAEMQKRKAANEQRNIVRQKQPTPAEALIAALEAWHDSITPEAE
jgi:hypothetical protein